MVGVPNMSLTCVFALAILFLNAAKALDQVPLGGQIPLDGQLDIAKKPNVVFILTDDQDLHMDSLSYMPFLQKHLLEQGTFYQRHFCTIALCCPSRVSLLTGKAAHNTNVTDVNPPYGRLLKTSILSDFISLRNFHRWLSQVHQPGIE